MARPPMFKAAEKQRIVLSVLRGECSVADAARRNKCSETSIAKWRDQFVQGGLGALEAGAQQGPSGARRSLGASSSRSPRRSGRRTWNCGCSSAGARISLRGLEMIRLAAGLDVRRFCALAGIATTTWYRQRGRALGGPAEKGTWPCRCATGSGRSCTPYALRHPAWGHRKIWASTVADGHRVSQRTVHRILDERGLLNGRRYSGRATRARAGAQAGLPRTS
jgi:transposase-like protein